MPLRTMPKVRAACIGEHCGHWVVPLGWILFEGQHIVRLLVNHLPGDALLAPRGSIVTMQPDSAYFCSRAGMAVIAWNLVSTSCCARTSRWAVAQALTRCGGPR